MVPSGGKSGPTGGCTSVAGSQPRGGRESGEGFGHRQTSWPSTGSGGGRLAEKKTSVCFWRS